jgi:hypothetical protein
MKYYITTLIPDKVKVYAITGLKKTYYIKAKNYENALLKYQFMKDSRSLK